MNEIRQRDVMPRAPQIFAFLRAAQVLEGRLEDALADVGLTTARFGVLAQLAGAGGALPLGVLAERLSCVRSNVTQLVDRLEADGLVRRVPDPSDRRSVLAELTEAGWARAVEGAVRVEAVQDEFHGSLGAADQAALERILAAIGQARRF